MLVARLMFCVLFAVLVACMSSPLASAETSEKRTPKVLLLGIDGCRFDALRIAKTPNIDQLIAEGIYSDRTRILHPRYMENDTVSGPGWSSILTGVWADKHGVDDNNFNAPNLENYPHFFVRLKESQPDAFTVSITTWPEIDRHIVAAADRHFSRLDDPMEKRDEMATELAIEQLANEELDAMFLYLGLVDVEGHLSGFHPANAKYRKSIEITDDNIGRVMSAIRERENYDREDWLVIVTSDHGGSGLDHRNGHKNPEIVNSLMIVSGRRAERGKFQTTTSIVDAPVTALSHLGVKIKNAWQLDGRVIGLKAAPEKRRVARDF